MKLDYSALAEVLEYDPNTGIFRWKYRDRKHFQSNSTYLAWNSLWPGKVAGSENGKGYVRIFVFGRRYLAHRLAWLWATGELPRKQIDHINRVRNDNRIENLRQVSVLQNAQNKSRSLANKSGATGVCWVRRKRRWLANITLNGKRYHLGYFRTKESAVKSRREFEASHYLGGAS